ncbi:uncharacterized protein LOC142020412 [Carettochelys insculpta]|uniref:uncharacterized protein LOC142020412 n=1 Tax=Carettochelys insculpta TaxID=44489 RepID=UPI003EC0F4C8
MRSQTLPASSRFIVGGRSLDTNSESQATRSWSESISQISSYAESSDTVDEESSVGNSQGEAKASKPTLATGRRSEERVINTPQPLTQSEVKLRATSSPEKSHKPVQEEPDQIFWDESFPKATTISTGKSEKEERTLKPIVHEGNQDPISSQESHETRKENTALDEISGIPLTVISLETSHKGYPESINIGNEFDPIKPNLYYRDSTANPSTEMCHQYRVPECLEDTNSNLIRSSHSSGDSSATTHDIQYKVLMHPDDEECDFNSRCSSHFTENNATTIDPRHRGPLCMDDCEADPERLSALGANTEYAERENIHTTRDGPPAAGNHTEHDLHTTHKGILFVKEYVNSRELSSSPCYSSGSLVDLSDIESANYNNTSCLHSSTSPRLYENVCTYCGREIQDCPKIMIEHLNVNCHEYCFRCGICHKAMGDLLDKIFIHRDIVHCDQCYEKLF